MHPSPPSTTAPARSCARLASFVVALVAAMLVAAPAAAQLPVVPGAVGFGIDTPAGRGGTVYRVTNLDDGGTGSLRACIEADEPRVCIFEVAGTIRSTRNLVVRDPYLTIAGQTAPSPGINLRGATLVIASHDVLVQHIRLRVGDDPEGPAGTNRDAIAIGIGDETVHDVVIDHVSMSWSVDEMLSIWHDATDVTLRHVIGAEALDDSIHIDEGATVAEPHGFGPIFGPDTGRVDTYGSLFAHLRGRQPLSDSSELIWVNNVAYDRLQVFAHVGARRGLPTRNTFVGNVYIEGPALASWARERRPLTLQPTLVDGSSVYVHDNRWSMAPSAADDWDLVQNESPLGEAALRASSAPTWLDGLIARPSSDTTEWVLAHAGARPTDRDVVDERIVREVRDGTGTVINCVAPDGTARCELNAGGWPILEESRRALTLPGDPDGDADGDGYTNLEEWLHGLAAEVEGTSDPAETCASAGGACCTAGTVCAGATIVSTDCTTCCPSACEPMPTIFSGVPFYGDRASYDEIGSGTWAVVDDSGDLRYALAGDHVPPGMGRVGAYALARTAPARSFQLTARIRTAEDLAAKVSADAVLVFAHEDDERYAYVMLNAAPGLSALFQIADGTRTELAVADAPAIVDVAFHTFVLTVDDGDVSLERDGEVILTARAPELSAGRVGIGSFDDGVYFDDVAVTGLDPIATDAGERDGGAAGADGGGLDGGDAPAGPTPTGCACTVIARRDTERRQSFGWPSALVALIAWARLRSRRRR